MLVPMLHKIRVQINFCFDLFGARKKGRVLVFDGFESWFRG